jgi:NAD(P)-dependent dehydrogenase (short-subunit alcohol dehydrogenase family)
VLLERDGHEVRVLDVADGFDVGDAQAWESVDAVELAFLNAGVTTGASEIAEVSDEAYARIRGANLDGVVYGVRHLARVMQGGTIVVTASLAGLVGMASDPLYTLTKHGVVGFVRSVAPQLDARGIRICAIAPGFADTPLVDAETRASLEVRLLTAQDVAVAAMRVAHEGAPGSVWVVQPGREPQAFRFPNVPGPR